MTGQRDRTWDQQDYNRENKFTRFFDDFLSDAKTHVGRFRSAGDGKQQSNWVPAIDVTENEREYAIIVDVPGVRKEDIDIEFNDTLLVLSGYHKRDPSTTAPQDINVKHGQQNGQQNQHQQSNHYQQQQSPPTEYQQQQQQQKPLQQPPTEYHQQQQKPPLQQQSPPTEYQQQSQKPLQQPPTEYHQSNQQPTEYHQSNQQPTEYHQSNQQPPTEYQSNPQQSTEYQSNQHHRSNQQQPTTEYHRLKKSHQNDDGDYDKIHIQERRYGHFSRSIQLPSNVRNDVDFHAKLENGVLKIKVPKNNDKPRRKITIS